MKKTLLLGLILSAGTTSAQMTQANEPALGTNTYFLVDSNAVTYDAVTGSNVTWDYSNLLGYSNETRDIKIEDPATTNQASNYTSSTKTINVNDQIRTYFSSTATERSSQGFVFTDANLGDVVITLSTDEEKLAEYPFGFGNSFTDNFSGNIIFNNPITGQPDNASLTGVAHASIDGQGTLILPDGSSITDVIRYVLIDTSYSTLPAPVGDMEIIRTQFEYYDFANSNMPLLTFSKLKAQAPNSAQPLTELGLSLSSVATQQFVGIDETELSFGVFPNPANDVLNIQGDFTGDAEITLMDQSGRIISVSNISNGQVNVAELESGIYFVKVSADGKTSTKTFMKK